MIRHPSLVLAFLALSAPFQPAWASSGGGSPSQEGRSYAERIQVVLLRAGSAADLSLEALGTELAALGTGAIPAFLDALESPSSDVAEEVVFRALESFGMASVRPFLKARASHQASREMRLLVLRVLERMGEASDLALALRAAGPSEVDPNHDRRVLRALEVATGRILVRDPYAYRHLKGYFLSSPIDLRMTLARAVGHAASPLGLTLLVDLLGFASIDAVLLSQIGRIAEHVPHPVDGRIVASVREYLMEDDPQLIRESAMALGKLEDFESVEDFIDLLGHDHASVRDTAHWSLKNVTGLRFHPVEKRWRSWYLAETTWLRTEGPRFFRALDVGRADEIVLALNELTQRRLDRHDLARRIEPVLLHPSPRIRRLACRALGELGSMAVAPALVAGLLDVDETVIEAAWRTLKAISGADLPPEHEAWQRFFGAEP